jgi:TolB-like protein/class 3 adenylate cyclase
MADERVERKLAAILAADVAGYSRLMGEDEAGTRSRFNAHLHELIEPAIASHRGRIVKTTGDALLVEFASVVDAVQCAVDIQKGMAERNADEPDDRRMEFRIGVNLGDVIIEGDDIHGDGVNVTARLEGMSEPGGICISGGAYEQVRNKVSIGFEDIGLQEVKNIAEPVQAYKIIPDAGDRDLAIPPLQHKTARTSVLIAGVALILGAGLGTVWFVSQPAPPRETVAAKEETEKTPMQAETSAHSPADKPSIAVLPFINMSEDKEQEYFADGMTEDLLTDLSKISTLTVISRTSTFAYKGKSSDVRAVAKELGASHVVEGSVRKAGGRVRITAQLIDAASGTHVWAERYDRELKDIFALQDEVRSKIISALSLKLTPDEKQRIAKRSTDNLEAYDLYMRGREQESFFNKDAFVAARRFYEQAVTLDPNFAEAYAHLAQIHTLNGQFGWVDNIEAADQRALKLAEKAIQVGPNVPFVRFSLSRILSRESVGQHDRAIVEAEKAIELDPNYADAYAYLGLLYAYTGNAARTFAPIKNAMRINPNFPFWYHYEFGVAHYFLNDYPAAVERMEKAIERNPTVIFVRLGLAAALAMAGRQDDAEWQIEELRAMGFTKELDKIIAEAPINPPYSAKWAGMTGARRILL